LRYAWDEVKRRSTLRRHGLDFESAESVFVGPTLTIEDDRLTYPEQRFVTIGFLGPITVSIVHTETPDEIRIISPRKATRRETALLLENLPN
jgi:hypothetical protein